MALILFLIAGVGGLGGTCPETERQPSSSAIQSFRMSLAGRQVAATSFAGMLFAGSQVSLLAYLAVYLWREAGLSTTEAGYAFAIINAAGVVARIGLGSIAERRVETAVLLIFSAAGMGISVIAIANFSSIWPLWLMYVTIAFAGVFGNGWVGLLFAELARLAPDGRAAEVAGGAQVFMYGGVCATPLVCGVVLDLTGHYTLVFILLATLALIAMAVLVWGRT